MRTIDEIRAIFADAEWDLFGFAAASVIEVVSREEAERLRGTVVKADADLSAFEGGPLSEERVLAAMRDYMPFALDKAENHRGLSAARSVSRFGAWLWLLGRLDHPERIEEWPYSKYGAPVLKRVCEEIGHPWPGGNEILAAMARGEVCPACEAGSESGCE